MRRGDGVGCPVLDSGLTETGQSDPCSSTDRLTGAASESGPAATPWTIDAEIFVRESP